MLLHRAQGRASRAGFVLCGGKSSRMGADKAFLEFGGQTLLARALAVMSAVCDSVTIIGDPAKYDPSKYDPAKYDPAKYRPTIADIFPQCGPLGGIHAALVNSAAEFNLMLAVDMPFVSTELLAFLFTVAENIAENDRAIVTVPRTSRGWQPLCAVYRRDFLKVAESALRAGKYKIDAAFEDVSTHVIDAAELAAAGFAERSFLNLNTPQDLLAAEN